MQCDCCHKQIKYKYLLQQLQAIQSLATNKFYN
jgi:hypothetical protein